MRDQIVRALQSSLDPLVAQVAVEALHPVLEAVSPPPLLRRRRRPRVLAPIQAGGGGGATSARPTPRFRLDPVEALRSRSEPTPLTVKRKHLADRAPADSTLPPLSLPSLQRKEESGYDAESVVGVLRLVRRQGDRTRAAPGSSPVRPMDLSKSARIEELRQRFQRHRSAITDSLGSDEEGAISPGTDLALVAKYFSQEASGDASPPIDTGTTEGAAMPLTPSEGSELSPTSPGVEGLLRWSSSLNVEELLESV